MKHTTPLIDRLHNCLKTRKTDPETLALLEDCFRQLMAYRNMEMDTRHLLQLLQMVDPMENGVRNSHEWPLHIEGVQPEVTELTSLLNQMSWILKHEPQSLADPG